MHKRGRRELTNDIVKELICIIAMTVPKYAGMNRPPIIEHNLNMIQSACLNQIQPQCKQVLEICETVYHTETVSHFSKHTLVVYICTPIHPQSHTSTEASLSYQALCNVKGAYGDTHAWEGERVILTISVRISITHICAFLHLPSKFDHSFGFRMAMLV